MDFNFSNEILFVGGFIIILVLFIQYMMYSHMKKYVKEELSKVVTKTNRPIQHNKMQNQSNNANNDKNKIANQNKEQKDDDSYDVETPEDEKNNNTNKDDDDDDNDDDDSYINPVHSEKNIDDDS